MQLFLDLRLANQLKKRGLPVWWLKLHSAIDLMELFRYVRQGLWQHLRPKESKTAFICAHIIPKRVGKPNRTPSASAKTLCLSKVNTGSLGFGGAFNSFKTSSESVSGAWYTTTSHPSWRTPSAIWSANFLTWPYIESKHRVHSIVLQLQSILTIQYENPWHFSNLSTIQQAHSNAECSGVNCQTKIEQIHGTHTSRERAAPFDHKLLSLFREGRMLGDTDLRK